MHTGIPYSVIQEQRVKWIAYCHEDVISICKLLPESEHQSSNKDNTIITRWNAQGCRLMCYFQGRNRLATACSTSWVILDVFDGTTTNRMNIQANLTESSKMCVLMDCIQNKHKHNAIPFAERNVIAFTSVAGIVLSAFTWTPKLEILCNEIQLEFCVNQCKSLAYSGGLLWSAQPEIVQYKILDDLSYQKVASFGTCGPFEDIIVTSTAVMAVGHYKLAMFTKDGSLLKTLDTTFWASSAVLWRNRIALVASEQSLCVMNQQNLTGYKLDISGQTLLVWDDVLIILDKSGNVEYRTGGTPWSSRRLLWLARMKNDPDECSLASVPVDILREIESHLNKEPVSNTCFLQGPLQSFQGGVVHFGITEKMDVTLDNDGTVKSLQMMGNLEITVPRDNWGKIKIRVNPATLCQVKTHPNIQKQLFLDCNVLALKQDKTFPIGAAVAIMKWRPEPTAADLMVPLKGNPIVSLPNECAVSVWPTTILGVTEVAVEFEKTCSFDLHNVLIKIPCDFVCTDITQDAGIAYWTKQEVEWNIPVINYSNRTGLLTFLVAATTSKFLPVKVSFTSNEVLSGVRVLQVALCDTQVQVEFHQQPLLSAESYTIEET